MARSLHLKDAQLVKVLALLSNNRLGWRCLPGTNTVAYLAPLLAREKLNNICGWCQCYLTLAYFALLSAGEKLTNIDQRCQIVHVIKPFYFTDIATNNVHCLS
jgi:hypothetical protein